MNELSLIASFLKEIEKYPLSKDYSEELKKEFNYTPERIKSIIDSAKIANLCIQVKTVKDSKPLGFSNRKAMRQFIIDNSEKYNWVFKKIKNQQSLQRKFLFYTKTKNEQSEYLALKTFITKNANNQYSRKITDEQLEMIKTLKIEDPTRVSTEIFKLLKVEFPDIRIAAESVRNYIRFMRLNDEL